MKKYINILLVTLCAFPILCACDDELDLPGASSPLPGNAIKFLLSNDVSRVQYADTYQLEWTEGDQVKIFCFPKEGVAGYSSEPTSAIYKVSPLDLKSDVAGNESGTLTLDTSIAGNEALVWSHNEEHTFYAVYGGDNFDDITCTREGKVSLNIIGEQVATVAIGAESTPDYTSAYMVASATGDPQEPKTTEVFLSFKPIMTTLDITVQGPTGGSPTAANPLPITAVSIFSEHQASDDLLNGQFVYDINTMTMDGAGDAPLEDDPSPMRSSILVRFNETLNFTTSGGQFRVTAFVPPIATDANRTMHIRVHSAGTNAGQTLIATVGKGKTFTSSATVDRPVTPGSRQAIKLPGINMGQATSNAWMTPLDDNIYVNQLSIPGTHDAGAINGAMSWGSIGDDLGGTQWISIPEQLNMGIRCLDLRPACYNPLFETDRLQLYHGVVRTDKTFASAISDMTQFLADNPGEFIVVLMRHESEIGDVPFVGQDQSNWKEWMTTALKDVSCAIPFDKDMVLKDARGKILFLCRDQYDTNPIGGYIYNWTHSQDFNAQKSSYVLPPSSGESGKLYVQDYYDATEDGGPQYKVDNVKRMLGESAKLHDAATAESQDFVWVVNHCSGYDQFQTMLGIDIPTATGYQSNAQNMGNNILPYIRDEHEGSTGIVMFDYVGTDVVDGYNVMGATFPQVIIDNNYKYLMRRATTSY